MNSFLICLNAIAPVFLVIGLGWVARRLKLIRPEDVPRMNGVAFRCFLPLMCFCNVYQSDLSSSVKPGLLLFALAAVLLTLLSAWAYAARFVPRRDRRGVVIQGLYRSNFVILGLPLAASLSPEGNLGVVALLSAVVVPVFNILAVLVLQGYGEERADPGKLLAGVIRNPLVLGCGAGLLALLIGLRLPPPVEKALRDVSGLASPLMLFLLGASFRLDSLRGMGRELAAVCLGRLLLYPGLGLWAAAALGFRGVEFAALLAMLASPTAVSSFTMAQQMGGDGELAGNIVVFTSLLCSLTVFGWSLLYKSLGIF